MKKWLKKMWHQLCFIAAIIIALIARTYWASALVFIVGIFVVGTVEIKRINQFKSENFIKSFKSKNINSNEKNPVPIALMQLFDPCAVGAITAS